MPKAYYRVSVEAAKANADYWLVLRNMFREQAARVLQRAWRNKTQKTLENKYAETLTNNAKLMRFIQEPTDNFYEEHANKILNGDWLSLNFQAPEFVRNIYKALRVGLLNRTQFSTALMLHAATVEFKNPIQQFRFDGQGPYQPERILYASAQDLKNFHEQLKTLPESEQCYFTVNFTRMREAVFLYSTLVSKQYMPALHQAIFKAFALRLQEPADYIESVIHNIDHLNHADAAIAADALTKLTHLVRSVYSDHAHHLQFKYSDSEKDKPADFVRLPENPDYYSQFLLSALQGVAPQLPMVCVSPHCDVSNPNSPLICFIIPSMSAFSVLEAAVHGQQKSTLPFFTAGKVSTGLIKALDESPEIFSQARQSRPVELTHPDLIANENPHNLGRVYPFILSYHDLFHTWQNGMLLHKPFIRYIRQLMSRETGFDMSKAIWRLTDMDFPSSLVERLFPKVANDKMSSELVDAFSHILRVLSLGLILASAGHHFWSDTFSHDINLLIILDMVLNSNHWEAEFIIHGSPINAFQADPSIADFVATLYQKELEERRDHFVYLNDLTKFKEAYLHFQKRVWSDRLHGEKHSNLFYLLAFRLRDHADGLSLCKQLENHGLNQFVHWTRNDGLAIKNSSEQGLISTMPVDELYSQLHTLAENTESAKPSNRVMR